MGELIKIICVLRSGGDYNEKYVRNLKAGLDRTIGHRDDWELICMTDRKVEIPGVKTISLDMNYRGWWSKIEAFRITGPCLFIDLDTVIISDISPLLDSVLSMRVSDFAMLEPFGSFEHEGWASGIMAWKGDWSFLFTTFHNEFMRQYSWDQKYINAALDNHEGTNIVSIQKMMKGIYSYKKHCKASIPSDTTIVCFHGKPRPADVTWIGWVKRFWSNE